MSTKPDTSDSQAPKYGLLQMMTANPLVEDSDEGKSSKKKAQGSGDFDNDDIQKKMHGVINVIQPGLADDDHKTTTTTTKKDSQRPASPLVGQQAEPPKRVTSPQHSKKDTNVLVVEDQKPKARRKSSSHSSSDEGRKRKDVAHKPKPVTRQDSSDSDRHKPSNKSTGEKTSSTKQQHHLDSSHTKQDSTVSSIAKKPDRRASTSSDDSPTRSSKPKQSHQDSPSKTEHSTISAVVKDPKKLLHKERKNSSSDESDHERLNNSKVSRGNHSPQHDKSTQSKHDQSLSSKKDEPTAHPTKKSHKSSDDDDSDNAKRASQPKKKASDDDHHKTATSTKRAQDYSKSSHNLLDLVDKSIGANGDLAADKSSQAAKPTSKQHHPPSRRSSTDEHKKAYDYFDDDDDLPKKHTRKTDPQSDGEQKKTDKEPKRRRPKRISRTTQTHEYIFRRMEREQHDELLPTNDTDKNIQTRQSQLRPRRNSPKKGNPIYLSSEQYKIEQIKSNKPSSDQQKGSRNAEKSSAQNGKLLILRPTLPIHHSSATKVERVKLQYAIDLVRDDSKRAKSPTGQRNKSSTRKQADQPHQSQRVSSNTSLTDNKKDHRTGRRTNDGAV